MIITKRVHIKLQKSHIKLDFINSENIISVIKYYVHIHINNTVPWITCFKAIVNADIANNFFKKSEI